MDSGEHLFRNEFGRIVTALSRTFGLEHLALAEDVAQDVFCRALEVWKFRGVPSNPSAWLMRSARNRAIDLLRREQKFRSLVPELESEWTRVATVDDFFRAETIADDQLRMIFSCCDPQLSESTQVVLTLHLLCGFTVAEIASAFLSTVSAIEKRIERGKRVLARSKQLFDLSAEDLMPRLSAAARTIYLLFNEGYHGASSQMAIRKELCNEALRLATLLLDDARLSTPEMYALCALMSLHAARLPARTDADGHLVSLRHQDRSRWDAALIAKGNEFLELSARGTELTPYHLEAAIASLHYDVSSDGEPDWERLVWLYDALLQIRPSPVIALNRAIAIAERDGPQRGIEELRAIQDRDALARYPFFPAAFGELEFRAGRLELARTHFEAALGLARNPTERRFLEGRIEGCSAAGT